MAVSHRYQRQKFRLGQKYSVLWLLVWAATVNVFSLTSGLAQSPTLPPPDDIPEEILRTEIILEGRSPVDGEPLTATEYTELMEALAENPNPPQLSPRIRHLVFLLKVRKFFRTLLPFL
ncbi:MULTISPECIES: hypothetical protein [unclassified Synechocystis]|uniref:hypothetical protein n=1 Tax=unclassified Synechocystis TaxID=2640012 RepID=UPI00041D7A68|nr:MULTISPECIES: hypothetical protein [unclassified Synechocystis]AIE72573.1 hypothetical protein D082_00440 [Synechocystis sp. PCC 6714]MCT0254492.1 hypothetical protein [Synechocystis sp. CS-94]